LDKTSDNHIISRLYSNSETFNRVLDRPKGYEIFFVRSWIGYDC